MTIDASSRLLCRRLPWANADAQYVLSSAEALLASMPEQGTAALRWYVPSERALVLGAGQPIDTLDGAACARAGVRIYRRAAGGTTVLLDHAMLGLDLALPPGHPQWRGDVTESYRFVGEAWVRTLRRFAIPAQVVEVATARAAKRDDSESRVMQQVCFAGLSPFEVTVGGRKLVGLSQVRRRHGLLFQISLLYASGVDLLASVLQLPSAERSRVREILAKRIVGLGELTSEPPPVGAVAAAFEEELLEVEMVMSEAQFSVREEQAAAEIATERYQPL